MSGARLPLPTVGAATLVAVCMGTCPAASLAVARIVAETIWPLVVAYVVAAGVIRLSIALADRSLSRTVTRMTVARCAFPNVASP